MRLEDWLSSAVMVTQNTHSGPGQDALQIGVWEDYGMVKVHPDPEKGLQGLVVEGAGGGKMTKTFSEREKNLLSHLNEFGV